MQNVPVPEVSSAPGWQRRRRVLFDEYERIALTLFAARGFRSVTIDEIAEEAGVSARTLFRYFPTKEDFLLAYARRELAATVDTIASLEPSPTPLTTAWEAIRSRFGAGRADLDAVNLWRAAAAEAPDVLARTRGERQEGLLDALAAYCSVSLGVDAAHDARPRLYAGVIAGADMAVIELWSRSTLTPAQVGQAAEAFFASLTASLG
ncbi:TetR family transcriptional regulator [Mycolicibacter senuensis]|nr:TetR family transcriptional regulator [Mycolicibacter senuensis]